MGRYAFFSTGISYKFAFAIQCSTDITLFGGSPRYNQGADSMIEWKDDLDNHYILEKLSLTIGLESKTVLD
jgi:hypothetical protein